MTTPKGKKSVCSRSLRPFQVVRSRPISVPDDPRWFFTFASIFGLGLGIAGWVLASTYTGILVPVCACLAIVFGLLGVRSKLRSLGLIGFVMGMFLVPRAITTLIRIFSS